MNKPPRLSPDKRLRLMREVCRYLLSETEALGGDYVGADVAYLLRAILNSERYPWLTEELIILLRKGFKPSHLIWQFIDDDTTWVLEVSLGAT